MIETARDYHHATSYDRHHMKDHFMDWQHPPAPHKHYPGLAKIALPDLPAPGGSSLWEVAAGPAETTAALQPDLDRISQVLGLAYGVTAERRQGGQSFFYRSAPSAGALYPIEIYLGAFQVPDLPAGQYHYSVGEKALSVLRTGDLRRFAPQGSAGRSPERLAVSFYITAIYFRSAWKYTQRAFRYVLLDGGHVLENLRLSLSAVGLGCEIDYDFDDEAMGHLLGLDARREACLAVVNVYGRTATAIASGPATTLDALPPAVQSASQVSSREVHYDEIEAIYRAGGQARGGVDNLPDLPAAMGFEPRVWEPIPAPGTSTPSTDFVRAVIQRRSRRNYTPTGLALDRWVHLVQLLNLPWRAPQFCEAGLSIGFLAANIQGLASGIYLLDSDQEHWGRVCTQAGGEQMAEACLNQGWLGHTAVQVLFMTHLPSLDRTWGARGYRYAMLTAGRLAQLIYLGASALALGCCGIGALYDGETRGLIGLDDDAALLYLVGLGPRKG